MGLSSSSLVVGAGSSSLAVDSGSSGVVTVGSSFEEEELEEVLVEVVVGVGVSSSPSDVVGVGVSEELLDSGVSVGVGSSLVAEASSCLLSTSRA